MDCLASPGRKQQPCSPLPPRALARGGEGSGVGGASANSLAAEPAEPPPTPDPSPPLRGGRGEIETALIPDASGSALGRCRTRNDGFIQIQFRDPAARRARGFEKIFRPKNERAQGMRGARCTRGLVCKNVRRSAHEHTGTGGGIPTFPAQWSDGLWRDLPGDQDLFVAVAPSENGRAARLGRLRLRKA